MPPPHRVCVMNFDFELVGKVGSMALINSEYKDIDYNKIARIGRELRPGMIWVTSGATEIGRLDYIKRNGSELEGDSESNKADYAAQGQSILMQNYRQFVDQKYSLRQILVEHYHFNNEMKRENLKAMLIRCPMQNAIPIINYNDAVCYEENRKMEIQALRQTNRKVVECVDNDETAAQIACLVKTRRLLILTSVDGIYREATNPETLIDEIAGANIEEVLANVEEIKSCCHGSSRVGAAGAGSKLEFVKEPLENGTEVIIANAKYSIKDVLTGRVRRTVIHTR